MSAQRPQIYLDYNATAPMLPAAQAAVMQALDITGNPSSVHAAGRAARGALEEARLAVAALAGARARDVVFTSGGTEAANAVLRTPAYRRILVSAVEHDCVLQGAAQSNAQVETLKVDSSGCVDPQTVSDALGGAGEGTLVAVMAANNETGVLQPIASIASAVKAAGARLMVDAVQLAGRHIVDIAALGADYLLLSAHKFGGPKGVGAVILAGDAPLAPLIAGGGQELGRRSGTENMAGIAGFGAAASEAMARVSKAAHMKALRDRLEDALLSYAADARIAGKSADRLANTSCILMPGVRGETQVMHFDLAGICVSSGSACSSGKVKPSHVLEAMGWPADDAGCALRVSLGPETTPEHIDRFIEAWCALYGRTQQQRAAANIKTVVPA